MSEDGRKLVGKCGIYCGSCPIYRAHHDGDEKTTFELAFSLRCTLDQIRCEGCGSADRFEISKGCIYRKCANGRGLEACAMCNEYPCESLSWFYEEGMGNQQEALDNSNRIRGAGLDLWLAEADARWRCRHCNSCIAVGMKSCHRCGAIIGNK